MSRTRIDRLRNVECGGYVPASVPPAVSRLLRQLKLAVPPKNQTMPMAILNAALDGRSIEDRLQIKSLLRINSIVK